MDIYKLYMDEDTGQNQATAAGSGIEILLKIEEMIKTHISQVSELQDQITKFKEMLDDIFKNDQTFQEHDKVVKETARIRNATKQQILKRTDVANIASKLKDLRSEKAELQLGLSDYLREYQRLSGLSEIESEDGTINEIVYTAKLIKKSSKYRPS